MVKVAKTLEDTKTLLECVDSNTSPNEMASRSTKNANDTYKKSFSCVGGSLKSAGGGI